MFPNESGLAVEFVVVPVDVSLAVVAAVAGVEDEELLVLNIAASGELAGRPRSPIHIHSQTIYKNHTNLKIKTINIKIVLQRE